VGRGVKNGKYNPMDNGKLSGGCFQKSGLKTKKKGLGARENIPQDGRLRKDVIGGKFGFRTVNDPNENENRVDAIDKARTPGPRTGGGVAKQTTREQAGFCQVQNDDQGGQRTPGSTEGKNEKMAPRGNLCVQQEGPKKSTLPDRGRHRMEEGYR